ncbi:MAG: ATP-binding protein, partial [Acidobacteriota bacterium]
MRTQASTADSLNTKLLLKALVKFRNGDFSVRLPGEWTGEAGKIADTFNEIITLSDKTAKEVERVSRVVGKEGKIMHRASVPAAFGSWLRLVDSTNLLIDDMARPTSEMARVIGAVANGDLSERMALEVERRPLKGEFLRTVKIVNSMVDQLSSFASEVTRVAREVGTEGKLGGEANVKGVAGTWKDLTDNVNSMASNLTGQVRNIAELENANLARLKMLIDLGHELAAEHDPQRVLENFTRSARQIVDAQQAGIGVLDSVGETLRYFFHCNSSEGTDCGDEPPLVARAALKWLLNERRPLRLNESDGLLQQDGKPSDLLRSFLGAPIWSAGGVSGWFYLLNKLGADDFTEADERLAATLATQAASAYENARLYSEAQQHASELSVEIAERKQAETERAQILVREQAARAEAEQANRTKDEFLATLSHELRTPLSAILGWSHLVRTGKLDEPQMARAFETIERNARSQSQLIDDLLDVSRIITGNLQIEAAPVDLSAVIESALDAVRPALEAKQIQLETVIQPVTCLVPGDPNRLQQIFWNLFTNAVKFTPQGGTVRVAVKRCSPRVKVSVSDSGIGISKDFLPFIFDRFRQADGSTTRLYGGLGLGLAIVKHLVQLHQGTIEVESEGKDQGATFTIDLPLTSASVSLSTHAAGPTFGGNGLPARLSQALEGLRILVVDDEADSRDLLTAILTRCGSEVRCTASVPDALAAFRDWKPDVVISDIGMPVEDGYSLIRKLRSQRSKRARSIPAIALTAYATNEDRNRTLDAGFQTHI